MANLKKQINKQLKTMPKYAIQPEAYENVALATARAFGRPQEIQIAEENLNQGEADALGQAQDYSSSTSGLLSTLAAIEGNKQTAVRNLAQDESAIKRQNTQDLYATKTALAEEKDKAWYQNIYAPWEAKLRALKEQKANRNALWSNIAGGLLSGAGMVAGRLVGGPAGAADGSQIGRGFSNIDATNTLEGTVA